jgi:hypothetical protein
MSNAHDESEKHASQLAEVRAIFARARELYDDDSILLKLHLRARTMCAIAYVRGRLEGAGISLVEFQSLADELAQTGGPINEIYGAAVEEMEPFRRG